MDGMPAGVPDYDGVELSRVNISLERSSSLFADAYGHHPDCFASWLGNVLMAAFWHSTRSEKPVNLWQPDICSRLCYFYLQLKNMSNEQLHN
jgi:hypothetical protein